MANGAKMLKSKMSDEEYENLLELMETKFVPIEIPTVLDDYNILIKRRIRDLKEKIKGEMNLDFDMLIYHDAVFIEGENVPSIDLPINDEISI